MHLNILYEVLEKKNTIDYFYWTEIIKSGKIDIYSNNNKIFRLSCINGHLNMAKFVYMRSVSDRKKIDIHMWDDFVFRWASAYGCLDVIIWLYSEGKIDIHVSNDFAFLMAINQGNLSSAKWAYAICNIDHLCEKCAKKDRSLVIAEKSIVLERAFHEAVMHNRINCVEWLQRIKQQSSVTVINKFKWCCEKGDEKTATYLMSYMLPLLDSELYDRKDMQLFKQIFGKYPDEINKLFKNICERKWVDMALLFTHLDDHFMVEIENGELIDWKILTKYEYNIVKNIQK
jgi:hypothetical protein